MTPEQRFDRIEGILERMAVRRQCHDEALERARCTAQLKDLIVAAAADGEKIRALARRAEKSS